MAERRRSAHAIDDQNNGGTLSAKKTRDPLSSYLYRSVVASGSRQACRPRRCFQRMTLCVETLTGHYFMFKFDFSWGIRTKMGKTEGIFLNLQCDCHRVASMLIKLINLFTNFSTLLPNVTAQWINGVSLNSQAHTFFYRTHQPNK